MSEAIGDDLDRPGLGDDLGEILGVGPATFGAGVFRTTEEVDPDVPDLGIWFERQTDDLPEWLAPFNGPRLVAFSDDGRPIAGVGIKIHDAYGHEVAVVTDEEARGLGMARRLVAGATRGFWPRARSRRTCTLLTTQPAPASPRRSGSAIVAGPSGDCGPAADNHAFP